MAVGSCFFVVAVNGAPQVGSTVRAGANLKRLFMYPGQTTGCGAPAIKPGDMRDLGRLSWSGYLTNSIAAAIAGGCGISGAPDFCANLVGSIDVFDLAFGAPTVGGLTAGGCFGSKLRIWGRTNSLVGFSLDVMSKSIGLGGMSVAELEGIDFMPLECGISSAENVLAFNIDYSTGFFARYAPDGTVGYTAINESLQQRSLRASITMAHGSASGEWAKHAGRIRAGHTISLVGSKGGAGCTIVVGGYYTGWEFGEVDGILVEQAELTGVWDGSSYISMS